MPRKYVKDRDLEAKRLARRMAMADLYRAGLTLGQIAKRYRYTKQRIHQCLLEIGITSEDSGYLKLMAERREVSRQSREARSMKRWGCTFAEYTALRALHEPTRAFCKQRNSASERGIPWQLSLTEWWAIWTESGKWEKRGPGQGYVMCRKGDSGAYAIGNVFIAPQRENVAYTARKKSGLPIGVSHHATLPRYIARRAVNGHSKYLGHFATPEEAHAAYLAAA